MRTTPFLTLCVALCAAPLCAQTQTYIVPPGLKTVDGNGGNTIPWWAGSGTYQQIHDKVDLAFAFSAPVAVIKALSFRRNNDTLALPGRSMDIQITLGATPLAAANASTSFATNLGPMPVVVLSYTNVSLPTLVQISVPNPQGWVFPFATPFVYTTAAGNLCYELRLKNNTSNATASIDSHSGTAASLGAFLGTGCVATGQSMTATIGARSLTPATGAYVNRLDRGAASAPAAMFLGFDAVKLTVPGFCTSLEVLPVYTINGSTDATGTWNLSLTFGNLAGFPALSLVSQFVFLDAGLPNGIGLSNCSPVTLPLTGSARIYASSSGGGQGNENATTGSVGTSFALVMGFDQ